MLRNLRSRRRQNYGAHVCAVTSALILLLLSVSLLYSRLSRSQPHHSLLHHHQNDIFSTTQQRQQQDHPLLSDQNDVNNNNLNNPLLEDEDRIDELDVIDEDQQQQQQQQQSEDNEEVDDRREPDNGERRNFIKVPSSGYYFDHVYGSIRRVFTNKRSIDNWDYDDANSNGGILNFAHNGNDGGGGGGGGGRLNFGDDKGKAAFGSDDIPVDEEVRRKATEVFGIEDALLLKVGKRVSPLREKWGDWFDKKSEFLRRDKMFKSNLESLNPLTNPMLQDPDGVGVTGLTRGDKLVQKLLLNEFKKVPFLVKKPLAVEETARKENLGESREKNGHNSNVKRKSEIKRVERRTLDDDVSNGSYSRRQINANGGLSLSRNVILSYKNDTSKGLDLDMKDVSTSNQDLSSSRNGNLSHNSYGNKDLEARASGNQSNESNGNSSEIMQDSSVGELEKLDGVNDVDSKAQTKSELSSHLYADGKRWGYYPGLHPHLSFSEFMDAFFRKGKCDMRVFIVWNSPPWMYTVRHQRGLESLLSHHQDACVVFFSETVDLDFFRDSFVKEGYKVAVAMPNLDELLKDTPTHIFASVWFEWRKTKFYSTHYSELIRLAALYKYGGIYLDSDVIVLRPLSSLENSVGLENQLPGSSLNGAVMTFKKQSPFIMECLKEFYTTYDDSRLRWNGADLLTRVAKNFMSGKSTASRRLELKVQPSFIFFPISSQNITRYFTTPVTETEKARQDTLFKTIQRESLTFHFWNSLTSALIPEPDSPVSRLIDYSCLHCSDVL